MQVIFNILCLLFRSIYPIHSHDNLQRRTAQKQRKTAHTQNSAEQRRNLWHYISALCASIILKFGHVVGITVLLKCLKFQIITCINFNVAYVLTKRFSACAVLCCFISWVNLTILHRNSLG